MAAQVTAWQLAWQLLQDEDDDVRDAAAAMCSRCCSNPHIPMHNPHTPAHEQAMPACLDTVQRRVVTMLAHHACRQPPLLHMLLNWICNADEVLLEAGSVTPPLGKGIHIPSPKDGMQTPTDTTPSDPTPCLNPPAPPLTTADAAPSWVHRLFEQEKVNDFEEPLTAARLTAQALLTVTAGNAPTGECAAVVAEWLRGLQKAQVLVATVDPTPERCGRLVDLLSSEPLRQRVLQLQLAVQVGQALVGGRAAGTT